MVPREGLRSPARRHADTHDCRNTLGHEVEGRSFDPGTRARLSALRGGRLWQMTRLGTPRRPVPLSLGRVFYTPTHPPATGTDVSTHRAPHHKLTAPRL